MILLRDRGAPNSEKSVAVELSVEVIVVNNNLESEVSSATGFAPVSSSSAIRSAVSTPEHQNEKRRKLSGGSVGITRRGCASRTGRAD